MINHKLSYPSVRSLVQTLALGALLGLGLSACDKAPDAAALAPIEIERSTSCELDGMLLVDYPGPKAQVFYAGQDKPVFFCDTVELFSTLLVGEQVRVARAIYVQDMGKASWEHPEGHWVDAKTANYVVGGKRHGSMGPTIASFSQPADADKFAAAYGGQVLRFADIKPAMVDLSGGALHDKKM